MTVVPPPFHSMFMTVEQIHFTHADADDSKVRNDPHPSAIPPYGYDGRVNPFTCANLVLSSERNDRRPSAIPPYGYDGRADPFHSCGHR
jgi:hypothetical protein